MALEQIDCTKSSASALDRFPLNNGSSVARPLNSQFDVGLSQSASHDALLHHVSDGSSLHSECVATPPSTPGPLRKLGSFKNVPKYGSFSGSPLFRYASQSDLPLTYNERHKSAPQQPAALVQLPNKQKTRLSQSGDSSKDFSSPCTTPTPVRKNRRRSNIFSKKDGDDKKLKNGDAKVGHGRVIPLKQGYLFKHSSKALSKDWQKKYVTLLDDGRLTYHSSLHDYMVDNHAKEIKLVRTTVKIPGQRPRGSESSVSSIQSVVNRNSNGQANKQLDSSFESSQASNPADSTIIPNTSTSSGTLPDADTSNLSCSVPASVGSFMKTETPNAKKKHRRIKSITKAADITIDSECSLYEFVVVSLDNKQWQFAAQSAEERDEWITAIEQQILSCLQLIPSSKGRLSALAHATVVQNIRAVAGNNSCADCGSSSPDWASLNLGALVCIECSGIHRNLGTHLSRVRSLELDDWPPELVRVMVAVGNKMVNSIWEANTNNKVKPSSSSPREEKDQWIRAKYEQHEFVAATPYTEVPLHRQLFDAVARSSVHDTLLVLSHCTPATVNMPYSDNDTRTALHIAAAVGHLVLLQLLVWNGANVKLQDHEGFSASYYAQVSGSSECVQLLQSLDTDNTTAMTNVAVVAS